MSVSDYEYTTPKERFDVTVNAINYFSICMPMNGQFQTIWNEAIACGAEKTGQDLTQLKV